MDEEGNVCESYEIENRESALNAFRSRYLDLKPEIALEVSTSGKYIARMIRYMGFSVHLADPSKLSLIFMTAKKNDKEDSYKLAKLLRLQELLEVHLPSKFSGSWIHCKVQEILRRRDEHVEKQGSFNPDWTWNHHTCNRHIRKERNKIHAGGIFKPSGTG